jgi:predicted Zn-dependent protease
MKRLFLVLCTFVFALAPLSAQERLTLLIDAETQAYFEDMAKPLLAHMNLHDTHLRYHIVLSDQVNAFVASARDVYFMTGLINKAETPDEVMGVLAHELGHLEGRHLFRAAVHMDDYKVPSIIAGVLGVGAVIAGAPQAGGAILIGAQAAGVSNLLRFTRSQEQQADQIAVNALLSAGYSPAGMESFFKKMRTDEVLYSKAPPPYLLTHPAPAQRQDFLANAVRQAEGRSTKTLPQEPFERIKAKLFALSESPARTLRRYQGNPSFAGRYAVAIAYARQAKFDDALTIVRELLQAHPDDAFLHELESQIHKDKGDLPAALAAIERALALRPDTPLMRYQLGDTLLNLGREEEALTMLLTVRNSRPDWARLHHLIGIAYGRQGALALSHLSLAESALYQGQRDDVRYHLHLAEHHMTEGDTQAKDRLQMLKQALENEKN